MSDEELAQALKANPWLAFKLAFTEGQWNPFVFGMVAGAALVNLIALIVRTVC